MHFLSIFFCFFLFFYFLHFSYSYQTSVFRNRVLSFGSNANGGLGESDLSASYDQTSFHYLETYPGGNEMELEIKEIHSLVGATAFLMENGDVYGFGEASRVGSGISSGYLYTPTLLTFPYNSARYSATTIGQIHSGYSHFLACTPDYEECFAFGYSNDCGIICDGNSYDFVSPLPMFENFFPDLTCLRVYTSYEQTIFIFRDPSTNELIFKGTGPNTNGQLGDGTSTTPSTGYVTMNVDALLDSMENRTDVNEIKHVASFAAMITFIITRDNRWFFAGHFFCSGCTNIYTSNALAFSEIPNDGSCNNGVIVNELYGKDIIDITCNGYEGCAILTNESDIFSWGNQPYVGRDVGATGSRFFPERVNISAIEVLQQTNDIQITGVTSTYSLLFIQTMDYTENRQRIFSFGIDESSCFGFGTDLFYKAIEVFTDHYFTEHMLWDHAKQGSKVLFLQDTSYCWGKYANDSSVACDYGTCLGLDTCSCDEVSDGMNITDPIYCTAEMVCYGEDGRSGCSDHGNCSAADTCECDEGWTRENCSIPICFDFEGNEGCSNHGTCIAPNSCFCDGLYDTSLVEDCSIRKYYLLEVKQNVVINHEEKTFNLKRIVSAEEEV